MIAALAFISLRGLQRAMLTPLKMTPRGGTAGRSLRPLLGNDAGRGKDALAHDNLRRQILITFGGPETQGGLLVTRRLFFFIFFDCTRGERTGAMEIAWRNFDPQAVSPV